eukprot:m.31942 g.31942  ORF g.31942 m.31942 type:complete len:319 (-) comp5435_c0_seq1:190-1146(-)
MSLHVPVRAALRGAAAVSQRSIGRLHRKNPFMPVLRAPPVDGSPEGERNKKLGRLGMLARGPLGSYVSAPLSATPLAPPQYQLVDDDDLEETLDRADQVVQARHPAPSEIPKAPESTILSRDPAAANRRFTFVFTDISEGAENMSRSITFRETDGTLRTATPAERLEINQKFFPREHSRNKLRPVFEESNVKAMMAKKQHALLLDMAHKFLDPTHSAFWRVHRTVYDNLDQNKLYSLLQNTRHWLEFARHLVRENQINGLLGTLLRLERLHDACTLVSVYYEVHPSNKPPGDEMQLLEGYIKKSGSEQLRNALSGSRQ